jgi:myo-inositol-1(or 4)-monophosphatase
MDMEIIHAAKELSIQVIREAGTIAKERFDHFDMIDEKDGFGDVVTEVDYLTEALILKEIHKVFPLHQVHSEEAGSNNLKSDWLWLIDPPPPFNGVCWLRETLTALCFIIQRVMICIPGF